MRGEFLSLLPYWGAILIVAGYFQVKEKTFAREILWASFRTTLQLILLAFALELIFRSPFFIVSLLVSLFMSLNSSGQTILRSKFKGLRLFWISLFSNIMAIWPIAFLFSADIDGDKWVEPANLLPLMGMLLGNTLSGVSIGLQTFMENFREKKNDVLTLLALGANREEATSRFFYRGLRAGITPQINSMISMGIISIPGMMAGQLISGTDALFASILQIKMMLSICVGTLLSIFIALSFVRKGLFKESGELC